MHRTIGYFAAFLLAASPLWAGELDSDFRVKQAGPKATVASPATATSDQAITTPSAETTALVAKGSELDAERPEQAWRHFGGWGRGWGGFRGIGWGGYRGFGWGRGWGGGIGFVRPVSWGWGGGWGGWGGYGLGYGLGGYGLGGFGYYPSTYFVSSSLGYGGLGYGWGGGGYGGGCWW